MGSAVLNGVRTGAVIFVGLSGFLFSCSSARQGGAVDPSQRTIEADARSASSGGSAAAVGRAGAGGSPTLRVLDTFDAPGLERQFEAVARRVSPAVVAISATEAHVEADEGDRSDDVNPEKLSSVLDAVDRTVGTGFIIDPRGYVVTNEHVIRKAERIWVTLDDRRVFSAVVVGADPRSDLAVLKVAGHGLPTVAFSTETVRRGQWALAVGNPYGLAADGQMALAIGIVSATGRSLPKLSDKEDRLYSDLIQTTAQINPGNSGGPLFDVNGQVIGVNTAVILPQKQTNGIGFAMPADGRLREIVDDLKDGREVVYGFLGVKVAAPTARQCRDAGIPEDSGALIERVEANSPAAEAHLRAGDIVARFRGEIVRDGDQFVRAVGAAPIGVGVEAQISRDGTLRTVTVHLRRRELATAAVTRENQRLMWRGLTIGPVPTSWPDATASAGAGRGLRGLKVYSVDPDCALAHEGVAPGAIVTTVAGKPVADVLALQQIINDVPQDRCDIGFAGGEGQKAVVSILEGP